MTDGAESGWMCDRCEHPLREEDTHCPNCGALFDDRTFCSLHRSQGALGVCLMCSEPFCQRCGEFVNERFLCARHASYEVFEDRARVYGDMDGVRARYVSSCLEQAGLHPLLYWKGSITGSSGGLYPTSIPYTIMTLYNPSELKILVPFSEVLSAEEILKDLDVKSE